MTDLAAAMTVAARMVEAELTRWLTPPAGAPAMIYEAMRFAALAGGKRFRPFLLITGAEMWGADRTKAAEAAAAVELIHCYSLVHDDLPAMDDDDLRRGRPTLHRRYDEATAILAGDAMLTLAFRILADTRTHSDGAVRCTLIAGAADAAGAAGMVGGQCLDLASETAPVTDLAAITALQQRKTGALLEFSCVAGAILAGADAAACSAMRAYGRDLGLAFQIADDLLDLEGDANSLGKAVGKDRERGKATFPALMGREAAREQARTMAVRAGEHLSALALTTAAAKTARTHLIAAAHFAGNRQA